MAQEQEQEQEQAAESTFRTLLADSARYLTHAAFPQIMALQDLVSSYKKKADEEIKELKDEVRQERRKKSSNSTDDEDVVNTLELGFEQINQHNVTHGVLLDSMLTENRKTNSLLERLVLGGGGSGGGGGGGGSGGGGGFGDLAKDGMEIKAVQWGSKLLGGLKGFLSEGLMGGGLAAGLIGGGLAAALNWGNKGEIHTLLSGGHENDSSKDLKDYYNSLQSQKLQAGVKEDDSNLAIQREALMKIVQKLDEMDKSGKHNPAVDKRKEEIQKEIDDLSKDKAQKESQIKALQSGDIIQTPQQQIAATRSTGQVALPVGGGVDSVSPDQTQPTFGQTVDAQRNQGAADILGRKLGGDHTITQGSGGGSGGGGHIGGAGAAIGDKLTKHLMEKYGLTREQATGPVGVMGYESGNFKTLQEIGHSGTGSGYGYAQWTGPRRTAFLEWSKEHKLNPSSYEANEGFMDHELETTYKHVIPHIKNESTARGSAHSWETHFEGMREGGPGVPAFEKHMQRAQDYYDQGMGTPGFKGGGSIGNESGGGSGGGVNDLKTSDQVLDHVKAMRDKGLITDDECVSLAMASVGVRKGSGQDGSNVHQWTFKKGENAFDKDLPIGTPVSTHLNRDGSESDKYAGGGGGTRHAHLDHAGTIAGYRINPATGAREMGIVEQFHNIREKMGVNERLHWLPRDGFGESAGKNYSPIRDSQGNPLNGNQNPLYRQEHPEHYDQTPAEASHPSIVAAAQNIAYSVGKVLEQHTDGVNGMMGRDDSGFDGDKRFGQMRNRGHDLHADMHGRFGGSNPMAGDAGMMGRMGIQPTDDQREAAEIKANANRWKENHDPRFNMHGRLGGFNSRDSDAGMMGRNDSMFDNNRIMEMKNRAGGLQPRDDDEKEAIEIKANAERWQHKLIDPKMLGRGRPNSMDNMKGRDDAFYDGSLDNMRGRKDAGYDGSRMDNMKGRSDAGYDGSKLMDSNFYKSEDTDLDSLIQKPDLINYAAQINQTAINKDASKPNEKPQDAMQKLFTELKSHDKDGAKDIKKEKHEAGPVSPPDERIKKLFTNYGGIGHGPQ